MRNNMLSKGCQRISPALAILLVGLALAPAVASADLTIYFQGDTVGFGNPNGRKADVTRSLLTSSGVNSYCSSCQIWAGAHYSGGTTLYANWATGNGDACHNYGTANIGAMMEAPDQRQSIFAAAAGWSGSSGGTYC